MKSFQLHITILAISVLLVACSDESKETPLAQRFYAEVPGLMAYAVSGDGTVEISPDEGRVNLFFDNDMRTMEMQWLGFSFSNLKSDYYFTDVVWDFTIGTPTVERAVSVLNLVSDPASPAKLSVSDFNLKYFEANELDNLNRRGFYASFTDQDGRSVIIRPAHQSCEGVTIVTTAKRNMNLDYNPLMLIDFNLTEPTADVEIYGISIPDSEGVYNIIVQGAKADFSADGGFSLTGGNIRVSGDGSVDDFSCFTDDDDRIVAQFSITTSTGVYNVECKMSRDLYSIPATQSV